MKLKDYLGLIITLLDKLKIMWRTDLRSMRYIS